MLAEMSVAEYISSFFFIPSYGQVARKILEQFADSSPF